MKKLTLILLLLITNISFVWAQDTIVINSDDFTKINDNNFVCFIDTTNELSISQIQTKLFQKIDQSIISDTSKERTVWYKFIVKNKTNHFSFKSEFHPDEEMILYQPIGNNKYVTRFFSRAQAINKNDVDILPSSRIELNIAPNTSNVFFIKTKSKKLHYKDLQPSKNNIRWWLKHHFIFGFIIGLLFITVIYNLFIYFFSRKKRYLFYVIYVFIATVYLSLSSGFLSEVLHLTNISMGNIAGFYRGLQMTLLPASFIIFSKYYLNIKDHFPKVNRIINIFIIGNVFTFFIIFISVIFSESELSKFIPDIISNIMVGITIIFSAISFFLIYVVLILTTIIALLLIKKNHLLVKYFFFADLLLLLSLLFFILGGFFFRPLFDYYIVRHIVDFAIPVQILIFSLGLSHENRNSEKEKVKLLETNNNLIKDANIKLEAKVKERTHEIQEANEELNQQNEEITAQRDEIEQQKERIEEIHHEVSESINYATRLQGAILPEEKILSKYVSEHFVLFKPKDKVSGDFYWWAHIENHTIITAADSTGHGVPGAFMSMLGASFLREIVQKEYITHTGVILRKLRKEIIKSLKQTGETGTQKDGMDMAIISIDHENNMVQFSGANNPLYIIRNEKSSSSLRGAGATKQSTKSNEIATHSANVRNDGLILVMTHNNLGLYEVKPDKMPIAIYEKMDAFTTHEIQLEKDDMLYMFSDGFADQFGGPKGKKFKYKPFKRLLLDNANKSMIEQKEILNQAFEDWKGSLEQIDDVVVLGVKI